MIFGFWPQIVIIFWSIVANLYYNRMQKMESLDSELKKTPKNIKNGLETKKIQQSEISNIFVKTLENQEIQIRILEKPWFLYPNLVPPLMYPGKFGCDKCKNSAVYKVN